MVQKKAFLPSLGFLSSLAFLFLCSVLKCPLLLRWQSEESLALGFRSTRTPEVKQKSNQGLQQPVLDVHGGPGIVLWLKVRGEVISELVPALRMPTVSGGRTGIFLSNCERLNIVRDLGKV